MTITFVYTPKNKKKKYALAPAKIIGLMEEFVDKSLHFLLNEKSFLEI